MGSRLLVIGAGPKAVALAAKIRTLEELGFANLPELAVVEKTAIAANWTGEHGLTDGKQALATPPEKDVGFPYASVDYGHLNRKVDEGMLRYSWQHFRVLASERLFRDWIDRGRPHPSHKEWARYLEWAADIAGLKQGAAGMIYKAGDVDSIGIEDKRWVVSLRNGDELRADGLVLSGPGVPKEISQDLAATGRFFDAMTFWSHIEILRSDKAQGNITVCVVGAGGTAAAIVCALLDVLNAGVRIYVVSPQGFIFSRSEGYLETRLYSEPSRWSSYSTDQRAEFLRRGDRGVFDRVAQDRIRTTSVYLDSIPGRARSYRPVGSKIYVDIEADGDVRTEGFDFVIDASTLNRLPMMRLFDRAAKIALREAVVRSLPNIKRKERRQIEATKGNDVERYLPSCIGDRLEVLSLEPLLHVPTVAGLLQGPGFPNLSSLGLLSDRILRAYGIVAPSPSGDFGSDEGPVLK